MDPNWYLTIAATIFGAVAGGLILLAWSITRWMLGESLGVVDATRAVVPPFAATRRWIIRIAAAVMAVASTTAGFAYLVYPRQEPTKPESPAPVVAAAPTIVLPPAVPEPAPRPAEPEARIDVGGVVLRFVPPAGYCLYPPDLQQAVLAVQRKANPENAVHIAFGDCEQLRNRESSGGRIRDFGLLMTPKAMLGKTVTKSVLAQYLRETLDPQQIQRGADKGVRAAERNLQMHSFASVGVLARSETAVYFGFLSRIKAGSGKIEQAGLMALTVIRGRLIAYYVYADYRWDPHPQLVRLQRTAKGGVETLAALNR